MAPPLTDEVFNVRGEPGHKIVSGEIVTCKPSALLTEINNVAVSITGAEQNAFEFKITSTTEPLINASVTKESTGPF